MVGICPLRKMVDDAYEHNAIDTVVFELVLGKEDNAINVAERMGFSKVATLSRFAKDLEGGGT